MSHRNTAWGKCYLLRIDYVGPSGRKFWQLWKPTDKQSAKTIKDSAKAYNKRYENKGIQETITLETDYNTAGKCVLRSGGTLCDGSEPLKGASLDDKLLIVSHAGAHSVGGLSPFRLAEALQTGGLEKMGLIAFKACLVGSDSFLNEFEREVSKFAHVGYYVGYKGSASTVKRGLSGLLSNKTSEIIDGVDEVYGFFGKKAHDRHRVKVVEGTKSSEVQYNR